MTRNSPINFVLNRKPTLFVNSIAPSHCSAYLCYFFFVSWIAFYNKGKLYSAQIISAVISATFLIMILLSPQWDGEMILQTRLTKRCKSI